MSMTPEEWENAIKAVFVKATTDADFRAKCLADPAGAFSEAVGVEAPAGLRFTEAGGEGIVLPPFGTDLDELMDLEELDSVAGGDPPQFHYTPTKFQCYP